jgi:hypothetical protein
MTTNIAVFDSTNTKPIQEAGDYSESITQSLVFSYPEPHNHHLIASKHAR